MNKCLKHFKTISAHKWYVMKACFKSGLYWQGILHDLSKYSITEFFSSAKYFQGDKSPVNAEKIEKGYSLAWQHHKGCNKHHWQYWTDFENGELIVIEMPPKYLAEMLCDWVGAGKAYNKGNWTIDAFKSWYQKDKDNMVLHALTRLYVELVIDNVRSEEELYSKWISIKRIKEDSILCTCQGTGYQPRIKLAR
ncbi:MAG: DUF5662 family protein [Candidatus Babeliales bacterium]